MYKKIDKSSPVPLYYQLYQILRETIEEDQLVEGDILYSEAKLQQMYDISRVTVRKALERLEREGFIERQAGRGTIVQNYKNTFHWSRLTSFTNDLQDVEEISSIVLGFSVEKPTRKMAHLLEIEEDDDVFHLKRIRLVNGQRIALSDSWMCHRIPVALKEEMFDESTSLFQILTDAGLEIGLCDETIEAKIPTEEMKDVLEMDDDSAVFYRERVVYTKNNRPFEYATIYYNANYYRYYIKNGHAYRNKYGL